MRSIASRAPPRTRSASSPGGPASVNTLRWWSTSEWTASRRPLKAAAMAAILSSSRPSDTLGTARSVGPPALKLASSIEDVATGVEHRASVELQGCVEHDHVEMNGHRDGSAECGAGPEGDVDRAEDLLVLQHVAGQLRAIVGADTELGQVAAKLAVGVQPAEVLGPQPAVALDDRTVADSQRGRLLAQAQRGQARGHDRAFAAQGRDEGLAAGEVPELAALGQAAVIRDSRSPLEV